MLPSSCHPAHITKNIPFSLAYRLKRICSEPEIFLKRLEELRHDLISRNYNPRIIETAFQKIKCIPREEALKKVVRSKTSDREPFCVTYHPSLPSVAQTVRNHHKVMVDQSEVLKRCFDQPSIIAYKKSKSLGDILIRAKISTKRKSNRNKNGFYHRKRLCILCITSKLASVHTFILAISVQK